MNKLYLLDTCAWLDAFNSPERLRPEVHALINKEGFITIAAITLLEVARKAEIGELVLSAPMERWFEIALPAGRSQVPPITPRIAMESTRLPGVFHKDPADRLIVATARIHGLTLITSDQKILDYPHLASIASR